MTDPRNCAFPAPLVLSAGAGAEMNDAFRYLGFDQVAADAPEWHAVPPWCDSNNRGWVVLTDIAAAFARFGSFGSVVLACTFFAPAQKRMQSIKTVMVVRSGGSA